MRSLAMALTRLLNERRLRRRIRRSATRGERELRLVPELMNGGTAIDVGANKGVYALMMSRHASRVLVFEPNPDFARHLECLPGNCRYLRAALSDRPGKTLLNIPFDTDGKTARNIATIEPVSGRPSTALETERMTLDQFIDEPDIQLIKIDVEGHEPKVLRGGHRLIRRHRPALIVEALDAAALDATLETLAGLAYRPLLYTDDRLLPLDPSAERSYAARNVVLLPA